jgi:hypothetical protein
VNKWPQARRGGAAEIGDPGAGTSRVSLIPQLKGTGRADAIAWAGRAAADISDQDQRHDALLALLAAAPDAVSWQADAVTQAVLKANERLGDLRGAVAAARAVIEDRPALLASILTAPALLPPETGATERRAIARAAEAVIAAVGDLRAPAAALHILAGASTVGTCPAARTAHAIEQARAEMRNASALLGELPGPLRAHRRQEARRAARWPSGRGLS